DTFEPHVMTGVDKLHAQGYFGKGITVGVVDTGIDYTHPALNSGKPAGTACFGAGCQISGGYDFVGDNYTGSNTPQPDSNPFANCQGSGHGTHVTGTIIAKDAGRGFTGVVPEANVKMYRVFGCGEEASVTDDVIIQAMTYAYFDGVDIISLSIGGPANWIESPAAATASRISYKGIPVYVANGNEGSEG
ncbi:subtilisin-like protein, partial [Tilletiaria anomala UBC 951]